MFVRDLNRGRGWVLNTSLYRVTNIKKIREVVQLFKVAALNLNVTKTRL